VVLPAKERSSEEPATKKEETRPRLQEGARGEVPRPRPVGEGHQGAEVGKGKSNISTPPLDETLSTRGEKKSRLSTATT